MDKYNRNYELYIEKSNNETLKITLPFTVEFEIHRNSFSSANVCSIRVYNLSADNRNQITKDQFDTLTNRTIQFRAGYGKNLSLGFSGMITQAWSVREGTNFITQIECYDGGYAYLNAITNSEFPSDTPNASIVDSLVTDLNKYGVSKGTIGTVNGSIARGNALIGNTTDLLKDTTNGGFFIDNSKANVLSDNECLASDIILINEKTGLLGTPLKENQFVSLEMLFEPGLKVGQLVQVESNGASRFNGIHKVIWIKHRGMISEAVCGDAVTSVGLLSGTFNTVY